jgi:hypothetical protein
MHKIHKKSWLQILAVIMLAPQNYSSFIMEELCTVLTTAKLCDEDSVSDE